MRCTGTNHYPRAFRGALAGRPWNFFFFAWIFLVLGGGCSTIGPDTIPRDRFAYSETVAASWKRQTLLNIVKLRYADTPVFLEVSQIINQYSLEEEVEVGASFSTTDEQNVGASGTYRDRPTITYTPLMGAKYTRSLLTPIPPVEIASLVQAGWPVDLVFRLCLRSVNGLSNRSAMSLKGRPRPDPSFEKAVATLRRLQESRLLGTRIERRQDGRTLLLFFRRDDEGSMTAEIRALLEILGLDPGVGEYSLVFGNLARDSREIAMLTRSMMEIMLEIGFEVEAPADHVAEGRAVRGYQDLDDGGVPPDPLVRIYSDPRKPGDAFVSVRYRGHWFWIEDRDFHSKRTFSFLMILFSLAETGRTGGGALVTVSAGD